MGFDTEIDLDSLIEAAGLAERLVGRPFHRAFCEPGHGPAWFDLRVRFLRSLF